jgi:serine/threonine-protein kinase
MAMSQSVDLSPVSGLPSTVRIGEVVAGKYRIERLLGEGGMGVVACALHLQLGQRVAIKFLSPSHRYAEGGVERFMQEARLAACIQSEHVIRVFDVASLDDGTPYIVMEYLEGSDLGEVLRRSGPFAVPVAVDFILQASEAIAEAHVAGVVHRDLKPGNLFVCRRPDGSTLVKVLDFGISKLLRNGRSQRHIALSTGRHVIMGSPLYASPEQLRSSRDVDARSDIWALGAILYETLSGQPPFQGATLLEICTRVQSDPVQPLASRRADMPANLESVITRCLAKSPDGRFATTADLARALVPFASRRSLLSVERIERVIEGACSAIGTAGTRVSPSGALPLCEEAPHSAPIRPAPASRRSRGRLATWKRWAATCSAVVFLAAACVANARLSQSSRPAARSAAVFTSSLPPVVVAATAAAASAPAVDAPAASLAAPERLQALAPGVESVPANAPSAERAPATMPAPPPRYRNPDTTQFGGLQ